MSTIFSRNEDGVVNFGEATITVPKNRSALSIIGSQQKLVPGGDYHEDGYVYLDGKAVKKWFTELGSGLLIWHPSLDDIPGLEQRYFNIYDTVKKAALCLENKIYKYTSPKQFWGHVVGFKHPIQVYSREEFSPSWAHIFSDDAPEGIRNDALTESFMKLTLRIDHLWRRTGKFTTAFEEAINRYYINHLYNKHLIRILHLIINSREYIFEKHSTEFCLTHGPHWQNSPYHHLTFP